MTITKPALLASVLIATLAAMPATSFARPGHGHHGHGHHHKHRHGGVRLGVHIGVPLAVGAAAFHYGHRHHFGLSYYAPAPVYYYPPPAPIIVNPAPVTYIERPAQTAANTNPSGYWYYCEGAKSYYPYVKECPAGWQLVPPTPER